MDMFLEQSWAQLVSDARYLRAIRQRANTATFGMVVDGDVSILIEETALSRFSLRSFTFPLRSFNRIGFFLILSEYKSIIASDSWHFDVRWRSRHRISPSLYSLDYNPSRIVVLTPGSPVNVSGVVTQSIKTESGVRLGDDPTVVLAGLLSETTKSIPSRLKKPPNAAKPLPFGVPKSATNPVTDLVTTSTATYNDIDHSSTFGAGLSYYRYYRSWVGTVTPGFRKLKAAKLPENNYSLYVARTSESPSYLHSAFFPDSTDGSPRIRHYDGTSRQMFAVASGDFSDRLYNRVLFKMIDKIGFGINANLAQDFLQFGQLTRLIGDNCRRLATSLKALKSGNFYGAALALYADPGLSSRKAKALSAKKNLAENWLALQYGWKPLLQDIHGLFKTLQEQYLNDGGVYKTRVGAGGTTKEYVLDVPPPYAGGSVRPTTRVVSNERVTMVIQWQLESRFVAYLNQTGFTNGLNLVWEVLPYSFVFDWLLPIGPFLESLSGFHGLSFKSGSYSQKLKLQQVGLFDDLFRHTLDGHIYAVGGSWSSDETIFKRTVLSNFPSARIPKFKSPVSTLHAANALALVLAHR